jgi:hypothetical protein
MNESKLFAENILISFLFHGACTLNWNFRIGALSLVSVYVFMQPKRQKDGTGGIDKLAVLARRLWFVYCVLLIVISCVSPHCEVHVYSTHLGLVHSFVLIFIASLGYIISQKASLRYGWTILIVILASNQFVYFNETPCYSPMLIVFNEICYWFAVSVFRFVNCHCISQQINQCKRFQTISTYPILFSTNYFTTILCTLPSVIVYIHYYFNSIFSRVYSSSNGDALDSPTNDTSSEEDDGREDEDGVVVNVSSSDQQQ